MLAPCPHSVECPLDKTWKGGAETGARKKGGTWCHFAERVPIPRSMRHQARARGVTLPSDRPVRLSYVVISREFDEGAGRPEARLTQAPLKRSGHVVMDACMPTGGPLQRFVVAKSHGEGYKVARKSKWGDAFPAHLVPQPKTGA